MQLDVNKAIEILKAEYPISLGRIEEHGKDKLLIVMALPDLSERIEAFVREILAEEDSKKGELPETIKIPAIIPQNETELNYFEDIEIGYGINTICALIEVKAEITEYDPGDYETPPSGGNIVFTEIKVVNYEVFNQEGDLIEILGLAKDIEDRIVLI